MPPPAPEGVSGRAPPVTLSVVCGFSGEINLSGGAADPVAVAAMADTMRRRGPDSSGLFAQGGVALGHRRLKIIDLSERGAQPMVDAELGLAVAFNGCIYNHHELRRELEGHGYRFFSTSDTEVLLKAYHHWGDRFVDHLVGMFALVITERDTGRVVLVRDRLGIKPLYLAESGGTLRFASTLPALVAAGGVDTSIDPVALHHYLTFHSVVPAPRTMLRGVHKMPPATLLAIEPDGRRYEITYWRVETERQAAHAGWSAADWQDALLASLRTAVERRPVADGPVGCLLSGGLDSSLIVGLIAEAGQSDLLTFSIGFESVDGIEGDEFRYSDVIARHFATDHHKIEIAADRLLPAPGDAFGAMSEPMVSHDVVAFYLLSQEVAEHVKVVQSGQAGGAGPRGCRPALAVEPADARGGGRPRLRRPGLRPCVLRPQPGRDGGGRRGGLPGVGRRVPRVRDRVVRAAGRRHADRPGAAPRPGGHARRRPGQARRQHDDGVGARGPGPVPRQRVGRAGRRLPARAEGGAGRQGRPQGPRPQGDPVRGHRPAQGLLPGPGADPPARP